MEYSPDLDHIGARPGDLGPHGVQEVGQIHNMRLPGSVFNDSCALRQHGGEHEVHGGPHAGHVQVDLAALQPSPLGLRAHIAVFDLHLRPQGGKSLQMLVDGPAAEVAAPGHGHLRLAEPPQHGPQQVIAGPELPPRVIGHRLPPHGGAVHLHGGAVDHPDPRPQILQNVEQQVHVADLGQILNPAGPLHQQSGGDDAHGGVLRAADRYLTIKRSPAVNDIFFQRSAPQIPGQTGYTSYHTGAASPR